MLSMHIKFQMLEIYCQRKEWLNISYNVAARVRKYVTFAEKVGCINHKHSHTLDHMINDGSTRAKTEKVIN